MGLNALLKKCCFGIAICQGKQELFNMPHQITKKSFWGIILFKTDKLRPSKSFPQQSMLPEK